jgi:hypothetical protein
MKIRHSMKWLVLAFTLLNLAIQAQQPSGDQAKPASTLEPANPQSGQINGIEFGRQVEVRDGIATIEPDGLHVKMTRELTYRHFLFQTGRQDEEIDQIVAKGGKPAYAKQLFQKQALVSDEANQTIHAIADDTTQKLYAIEKKYEADLASFGYPTPEEWKTKEEPAWLERVEKTEATVEQAMTRLRQELSEDDFRKIDAFIYRQGGGGRETIYHYTPISEQQRNDSQP